MYERSAIVLERYFENLFGFNKPSNLAQNYKNYCELFEKFNNFQNANSDEFKALEEFQQAEEAIENIQKEEEKLYKKNAKYEYNRDIIFSDITQKPDEIENLMQKIEGDIAKTQNSLVTLREKFVDSIRNYNDKKSQLSKCKKNRKNAESEYNAIFEVTKQNIDNIAEEFITVAKGFSSEEGQEDLIDIMLSNGKDEKIPFNNSVVRNAVKVSFDIQKRFIDAYLEAYNKTNKLIGELLEGAVSVELHEKTIRNIRVKLNFLNAEKDYLVQFLDYERIMVIHGKRTHRNLMLEACENFETDVAQLDNLYTLLQKEISNKSTKKAYKELYNKSYLIDIEENDEKFKKEKNKINLSTATIMNTNYWRIEGIKNLYTVFYKDVVEVFGKTVDEFEVPKEQEDVEDVIEEFEEESLFETVEADNAELEIKVKPIEAISADAPALPGMAEAVEENEKVQKAEKAKKTKKAEKVEVVEVLEEEVEEEIEPENVAVAETLEEPEVDETLYDDLFDEIEEEPELEQETVAVAEMLEEPEVENFEEIEVVQEKPKKKAKKVKRYTRKKAPIQPVQVAEIFEEEFEEEAEPELEPENVAIVENLEEPEIDEASYNDVFDEIETEPDIFGEKYRDIEKQIAELDALDDLDDLDDIEEKTLETSAPVMVAKTMEEASQEVNVAEADYEEDIFGGIDEDMPYEDEDIPYEEESIFENITNEGYEELSLKKANKKTSKKTSKKKEKVQKAEKKAEKPKKNGIIKNIMKLNSKDKKKVAAN